MVKVSIPDKTLKEYEDPYKRLKETVATIKKWRRSAAQQLSGILGEFEDVASAQITTGTYDCSLVVRVRTEDRPLVRTAEHICQRLGTKCEPSTDISVLVTKWKGMEIVFKKYHDPST